VKTRKREKNRVQYSFWNNNKAKYELNSELNKKKLFIFLIFYLTTTNNNRRRRNEKKAKDKGKGELSR